MNTPYHSNRMPPPVICCSKLDHYHGKKDLKARRKRKGKDLDEIFDFIEKQAAGKRPRVEPDPDLPGEGLFYCKECEYLFSK
ncbi:unnamed protein product [Soboliphyme baturini]|uniref:Zf-TFIIB domain-containing protein n=1 Tax=Soboliphyme baturini TaxID=241478 RepID=A0A183IRH4_9BILA|nr:unnamed protein product [Soboliphyme baturini]